MMAAITAAKENNQVVLIEKMERLGRKLLITGKGRCNITSSLPIEDFIKNTPGNGKFLYSCFMQYTNEDILKFLKKHNVQTKVERGNRIFPTSDKSLEVLQALKREIEKQKIEVLLHTKIVDLLVEENKVTGVLIESKGKKEKINADKVILATGGKSYPATGSTGDGYKIAKKVGHTITAIKPSLVPLETKDKDLVLCKKLQGLALKNIQMKLEDKEKNKVIYEDFGELLFTHFGVSGPTILSSSAHLLRYKQVEEKLEEGKIELTIDLKPALSYEKLDERILRDFSQEKNKQFKNSLDQLLPKKMIEPMISYCGIKPEKQVNEITKKEREKLVRSLKNFKVTIAGFRPIEEAIITSGGVSIKEINPKTMESKLIEGLYFAGEIIDVDAYTGGFNLQIAYSTGYVAGKNI